MIRSGRKVRYNDGLGLFGDVKNDNAVIDSDYVIEKYSGLLDSWMDGDVGEAVLRACFACVQS